MRMKHIFDLLHNADDKAISRMAEYPAMDAGRMERLFAASEEKSKHPEAVEEPLTVTESRRPQWTRAALVAACMVICGTTAAGIGALSRMAPPPKEELTAEVTPAATASETVPEETEPVTSMTAAVPAPAVAATEMQTEAETQPTEGTAAPTEALASESPVTAAPPVPTEAAVSAPAAETVQTLPTEAVPEPTAAPEKIVLTYDTEVTIPGFTIEKDEGKLWMIRPNSKVHYPRTIGTQYRLAWLPEGVEQMYEENLPQNGNGYQDRFLEYQREFEEEDKGVMYDFTFDQNVSLCQVNVQLSDAVWNNAWQPLPSALYILTVSGHPAFLIVQQDESLLLEDTVQTTWQLAWDNGDCLCTIQGSTFTDIDLTEDILRMAESMEPVA